MLRFPCYKNRAQPLAILCKLKFVFLFSFNLRQHQQNCFSYDHLVDIIRKIIVERPKNVADHFEDLSRQIRQERFRSDDRTQRGFYQTNYRMDVSEKILAGLVVSNCFFIHFRVYFTIWQNGILTAGHGTKISIECNHEWLHEKTKLLEFSRHWISPWKTITISGIYAATSDQFYCPECPVCLLI